MRSTKDIDQILQKAVSEGDVPGVVAMVANKEGVIYKGTAGSRKKDSNTPMTLDTVFWIASMTKSITAVAVMQLVEKGKIKLDDPVADILPELNSILVLEGFDSDGRPQLKMPTRSITLRHLLTHTAGFTYDWLNAEVIRYMELENIPRINQCQNATLQQSPLIFNPGDRWEYGISIDWVGKLVEALSDQSLNDYFKEHLFDPLGMSDTGFIIQPEARPRKATVHKRMDNGSLTPIDFEITQDPEFFMGGAGLYSTATDYLTFLQMLLQGGTFNEARILSPETVEEMGRNQIGALNVLPLKTANPSISNDLDFFPGIDKKWGLGYMITTEEAPTGRSAGSLFWAGLANTYYWIDPVKSITGVLMTQILPFADQRALDLFNKFERCVYEKIAVPNS